MQPNVCLRTTPFLLPGCLIVLCLLTGCSRSGGELTIHVEAGDRERANCPVFLDLPPELGWAEALSLARADSGARVPVQRVPGEPARAVFILDEPLAAGKSWSYELSAATQEAQAAPAVTATEEDGTLTVRRGAAPVLVFQRATAEPPEGTDPVFRRSGFIHPLYTPSGKIVTDDFPPDHWHQHGVFFAWVNTSFDGKPVDFWNQAAKQGDVEYLATQDVRSGPVFAGFTVVLSHIAKTDAGPVPVLEEVWNLRIYNTAGPFLVDLESEHRTAGESPLTINQYHYGGFAMRGAREWFGQPESDFLTNEGKTRADGNHTRPLWVEMHGRIGGEAAGVVTLDSRTNFRHPQTVRLHPSKPYLCFAPMVDGAFTIAPGETYVSRYRLAVHDGPPDAAVNDRLYADYATPPRVH